VQNPGRRASRCFGARVAAQYPLAREEVCWHGEAVIAVVAKTRAQAEDAVELDRDRLDRAARVATIEAARGAGCADGAQRDGEQSRARSCLRRGDVDAAFSGAAVVARTTSRSSVRPA